MKNLIFSNFKMNKTFSETKDYIKKLDGLLADCDQKICFFLPYTSLYLSKIYKGEKFSFGAQNVHEEEFGSFTGEISAPMLKDLGVKTVLLNHSERAKCAENAETINKRIKTALRFGFTVVLCVGETRTQKNTGKTKISIEKSLSELLNGIYENELKNIIISYEPIWAVGTGVIADAKTINDAVSVIRSIVSKQYSEKAGKNIAVIYGGSINAQNAKEIYKNKNIDGILVGGTSLNPEEFAKIVKM
ncbi:MAG: triose-phosphate isomerase [Clostridia bacterium]|nr:triose-phosphate isomerase [Clostridia bacterium]